MGSKQPQRGPRGAPATQLLLSGTLPLPVYDPGSPPPPPPTPTWPPPVNAPFLHTPTRAWTLCDPLTLLDKETMPQKFSCWWWDTPNRRASHQGRQYSSKTAATATLFGNPRSAIASHCADGWRVWPVVLRHGRSWTCDYPRPGGIGASTRRDEEYVAPQHACILLPTVIERGMQRLARRGGGSRQKP